MNNKIHKTYNYYEVKREYEKLYSDIISFDRYNLNDKNLQWELYERESQKLTNKHVGSYNQLIKYDETFNINDKINLHYMDIKQGIIKSIDVEFNTLTWKCKYLLTVQIENENGMKIIDSNLCIHLVD